MLFNDSNPVLGSQAKVEINQGANAPTQACIPLYHVVDATGLAAASTSQSVFVAPPASMGTYALAGVSAVFGTASTSGTLQVEKTPSGTAVGSGTNLLTGTVSLAGTANTSLNGTLVSNPNTLQLAAGDRISLVFGGTMTSLANCTVTVYITRVA